MLGEQSGPGGTTRTVDSSLERVQVLVAGLSGDRHVVTCNGYPLPLAATGTPGKPLPASASAPGPQPKGFHPTIAPHVPLTFDIVDTWNGRSIGGCRYHAAHPGGRNFQTLPVNALEAEGRRLARFETIGHSPGAAPLKTAGVHPDFPLTLDLRRVAAGTELTGGRMAGGVSYAQGLTSVVLGTQRRTSRDRTRTR